MTSSYRNEYVWTTITSSALRKSSTLTRGTMSITTTKILDRRVQRRHESIPVPKMYPKSGFREDGETFPSSLTHQVARVFADIPGIAAKFTLDKRLDRFRMQIRNSPETTVIFSADLLEFMGFSRKMIVPKELDRVGPNRSTSIEDSI
jgi:hypothetical protein